MSFLYLPKTNVFLLLLFVAFQNAAAQSLFVSGEWLKIAVIETGVHRIDASALSKLNVKNRTSNRFQLFGFTERQLPQENTAALPTYKEIAIEINDADGQFSGTDFLLFYAEGPHKLIATDASFTHQTHAYSDTAYYFLNVSGNETSKRIQKNTAIETTNAVPIMSFDDAYVYEKEEINLQKSGRQWFSDFFNNQVAFTLPIEGILPNSELQLRSVVLGTLRNASNLEISLNDTPVGSHALRSSFYDATHPSYRYFRRGYVDEQLVKTTAVSSTLKLTYRFPATITSPSGAYIENFLVHSQRDLRFYDKQSFVRSFKSLSNETTEFILKNHDATKRVWEISNPFDCQAVTLKTNGTQASFQALTKNKLKNFVLFTDKNQLTPANIYPNPNEPIIDSELPNLLIISSKEFFSEASRLARFRRANDNLTVNVVTTQQIYNHFSGGMTDPTALRNYIRELWRKAPEKLRYVLLFGDGTFDYKNKLNLAESKNDVTVPTYESRESLEPVYSHSSDDYFGFLEPNEGFWREGELRFGNWNDGNAENATLDVGIGRLPVRNSTQAKQVVDKLIYYDTSPTRFGAWRSRVSFLADDEDVGFDYNIHLKDADLISDVAVRKNEELAVNKIYLGAMPQIATPNGQRSPEARKALNDAVERGSLIVNYNGHGSVEGWTDEKVLTIEQLLQWRNLATMPVFLTATCEFGRYDNPGVVSGAELAILNPKGGGIGLLTTTRAVYSSTNFLLNNAFYNALDQSKDTLRLGDVFRETKNASISGMANRNFTLLGDPSMRLPLPQANVKLLTINNKPAEKQQLRALQRIKLGGEIADKTFNGKVQISVFDKPIENQTLPQNNSRVASYKTYKNLIFRGTTNVKNGLFESEFIVPKDIDYRKGEGKMYFYAVNADSTRDVAGSFSDFTVGGSEDMLNPDNTPPKVILNINPNNVLTAEISDESGINLSETSIGHEISIILNDTLKIVGNPYYIADGDFTKGKLVYSFGELPVGKQLVRVKVWDTYNNATTESLSFVVVPKGIEVNLNSVFPNPSSGYLTFEMAHSAINRDLNFTYQLINNLGQIIYESDESCYFCDSPYEKTLDLTSKVMVNGSYFLRVVVQDEANKMQSFVSRKVMFWK